MPGGPNRPVAVVTGGSRGVGRGIALGLGEAGWTVYVTGRTVREGDSDRAGTITKTAAEVTAAGGLGIAVRCDHKLDADTEEAFARVKRDQGRLDLLVNNAASYTTPAGPPEEGTFWEQSLDVFDQLNLVGLRSTFVASICAARMMVPNRAGLIVNVSSAGAAQPGDNVPYNVVKAGVDMMTQGMAKQLQGHGVAVLSIWPRLTRTEGVLSSPVYASHLARAWHPEFNGRAVAALAADPAVLSKTGRAIDVLDLSREYGFTDVDGRRPDA